MDNRIAPCEHATPALDVERWRQGDPAYFRMLVDAYGPRLHALVRVFSRDADEAADLLQDAWIRIYEKRAGYDGRGSLPGWMLAVCRSVCLSTARRRHPVTTSLTPELAETLGTRGDGDDSAMHGESVDVRHHVLAAVAALPDRQRDVVLLRLLEERSTRETADALGCAEGTVKATLHQALRKLAGALRDHEP